MKPESAEKEDLWGSLNVMGDTGFVAGAGVALIASKGITDPATRTATRYLLRSMNMNRDMVAGKNERRKLTPGLLLTSNVLSCSSTWP